VPEPSGTTKQGGLLWLPSPKKMKSENKCELLANEILKILGGGLNLSSDVVHYIDSTFSNPTVEELRAILQDESNCEKDSLIELLFFPDESMQIQLENVIEEHNFLKKDEEEISNYLCRKPLRVYFHLPANRGSLHIELPNATARQFIKRLHISRQLDRRVVAAIDNHARAKLKKKFKVKLRNSRLIPTDNKIEFLAGFFEKFNIESSDVFEHLDFVLSFLEEIKEDADIFKALMAKKKFYLRHLKRTEKFEDQLQKTNMETLMLQGKRAAFVDKNEARKMMLLIDRISQAVFGKTEYFEPLHDGQEFIELRSDKDVENIIKILS
jgi:hypothetical protein